MTTVEHDGRQSLAVVYQSNMHRHRYYHDPGWQVVRTCACHAGESASIRFATPEEADRCLEALDRDARRYAKSA